MNYVGTQQLALEQIRVTEVYGGIREQVFALNGNDMIYGSVDSQLYGGKDDVNNLVGAVHNWHTELLGTICYSEARATIQTLTGGSGNDKLFAGVGDSVLDGGKGAKLF